LKNRLHIIAPLELQSQVLYLRNLEYPNHLDSSYYSYSDYIDISRIDRDSRLQDNIRHHNALNYIDAPSEDPIIYAEQKLAYLNKKQAMMNQVLGHNWDN
jgi:hypothetical protein